MIQLSYKRLLTLICFVLSIGTWVACTKKDSLPNDGKAALYSFGPTGAKIGDTLRFIGVNLDQVTSVRFTGVNAVVDKANFTSHASDLIKLIVPQSAEKGKLTLKLSNGDSIVTKTALNLNVLSTVTSITTQARPGDNVTINGTYLNWIDRVTFNKNKVVTNFVSQSQSQLVVKVPDDAQTGTLVLHYGGTDSADLESEDTLKVTLPIATSFSPNSVKHGTNVTINGTDLDLVKKVYFNGDPDTITTFVSQSATQLVVQVPPGTTNGKVTLEAASGVQTTSDVDLDVILPAITSMSPNPVDPSTNLTITGTDLDLVSSVTFLGVANPVTSFVSQSATQLVVTVPSNPSSGKITLGVKNSTLTVKSPTVLGIVGAPLAPIIIYDDAITPAWNGWIGGGWGGTKDLNNTSPVRSGSKSVRIDYTSGAYGVPLQLGGANIPLDGYTTLKVSIYGGTGSNGKSVNIGFNEQDGKTVTLVEGQWTDFSIPLSQISSATTLSFLYIKNYSASGDFTIYVDDLGIY